MSKKSDHSSETSLRHKSEKTQVLHLGRDPDGQHGFINPPIYRGSTVLFPTVHALENNDQAFTYGRKGTPTTRNLEESLCVLEGGFRTFLTPSGLSAVSIALMSFIEAGDHILITDNVYQPTRRFCHDILSRLNVDVTFYDPMIGGNISSLFRPNTRLVFTEAPGSQTLEVQDIPAISRAAAKAGIVVLMDNTWATPLYFKPFDHGVDVSIHSATKYIVGHADALLGVITANEKTTECIRKTYESFGQCPGPEDVYLALRGLRTLAVRLEAHEKSALEIAHWLSKRPEVQNILHPALPSCPGHEIWKRDFKGSSGLFSVILHPLPNSALEMLLNSLQLFGMGWSWGSFESLVIPFNPRSYRTATEWKASGPCLRFHIGLDQTSDLIADLERGFAQINPSSK